jgi:phosphoribosyl-ATP pyrophosphohydrolase
VRTNPDYTGDLLDHGKRAYEKLVKEESVEDVIQSHSLPH